MPVDARFEAQEPALGRWGLIRNVLILQLKLGLDGIRDFVMVPISMVCLLAGLVIPGKDPGRYYERLLAFGQRSDRWINLFGEHGSDAHTDVYVRRVEEAVVRQYHSRRQADGRAPPAD